MQNRTYHIYMFFSPSHPYTAGDDDLKDEIMNIKPVQKQSTAGQRTRFKAWVAVGDHRGHVGLGQKCAAEVGIAIRGAHTLAKLSLVPVRKGYWGSKMGDPHTVPCKLTGKCGSVRVRLIPAPRGSGLVAAAVTKKLLSMAGAYPRDFLRCLLYVPHSNPQNNQKQVSKMSIAVPEDKPVRPATSS